MRVVRWSLACIRGSRKGMLERDRWDYGSAPWVRVSGTNQRFDVSEGCVAAGTTGISEMFLAVLEPYAGKLARTVLRGPRFRKGMRLPSNEFFSVRQQMMQQAIFMKASWINARRSKRMRSRRKLCNHEMVRSTTQRVLPRPLP